MAISLVTGGALGAGAANGGNVTITLPTLLQGDVVIAFGGHPTRNGSTVGPSTAGYTSIYNDLTNSPNMSVAYKVMGATPDTTFVGLGSGNTQDAAAYAVLCLRGVSATVVDATRTLAGPTTGTNPDCAAIVTQTDGAWVLALALSVVQDTAITNPTNYVNQATGNATDNNAATVCGSTRLISSAGSEDPGAYTNWLSGAWVGVTVAIRPTTLPVTVAESAAASDAPSAVSTLPVTQAESAAAADAVSGGLAYAVGVTESAAAADTPSAGALRPVAQAESAAASDSASGTALYPVTQTESAAASDAPAATALAVVAQAESAAASDSPAATALISAAVSETATASDAQSATALVVGAVSEAATADDSPSAAALLPVTQTESAAATDDPAATALLPVQQSEAATASDATTAGALITGAVTESAGASDAVGASALVFGDVSESAQAGDLVAAAGGDPCKAANLASLFDFAGHFEDAAQGVLQASGISAYVSQQADTLPLANVGVSFDINGALDELAQIPAPSNWPADQAPPQEYFRYTANLEFRLEVARDENGATLPGVATLLRQVRGMIRAEMMRCVMPFSDTNLPHYRVSNIQPFGTATGYEGVRNIDYCILRFLVTFAIRPCAWPDWVIG